MSLVQLWGILQVPPTSFSSKPLGIYQELIAAEQRFMERRLDPHHPEALRRLQTEMGYGSGEKITQTPLTAKLRSKIQTVQHHRRAVTAHS